MWSPDHPTAKCTPPAFISQIPRHRSVIDVPAGKGCCAVVVADLDDDGILDLAAVNHEDSTLLFLTVE
jgi:hypothetical protein